MEAISYTIEDGRDHILEKFYDKEVAIRFAKKNPKAREIFAFDQEDELIGCIWSREDGGACR